MTREQIMEQLYLSENEVVTHAPIVMEKLFCVAIINQGTDVAVRILNAYQEMDKILYPIPSRPFGVDRKVE